MRLISIVIFTLWVIPVTAQQNNNPSDTINFPYWIEMMKDPTVNLHQTQRAFQMYWNNRPILPGSGYNVFKRWEYMAKLHADESGNISYPKSYKPAIPVPVSIDKTFSGNAFNASSIDSSFCGYDTSWIEMGPNYSKDIGRINTIAFHPTDTNIMLCGAASGGLWKTIDAGKNWFIFLDTLPTLGVASIAFDYNNPNIIYLGTGDKYTDAPGFGLYVSKDGGLSWVTMNNGITGFSKILKIVIDPINPSIIVISTNKGIFRTINKGLSWKKSTISGYTDFTDLLFNPSYRNILYSTSAGQFFKSIDSGKSFVKITKGITNNNAAYTGSIAVSKSDSSYVYFLMCDFTVFLGIYRSVNFGDSFALMANSPNLMGRESDGSDLTVGQAFFCQDIAVSPQNKDEVYVGGINIFKSANGGKTWAIHGYWRGFNSNYTHADIHSLEFNHISNTLYSTNDGGIYKYFLNKDWKPLSNGLGVRQAYKVSTCNNGKILGGFQDNGSDMNTKLDDITFGTITGGDGMDNCFNLSNPDNYYTSSQNGVIYKNTFYKIAEKGTGGITEDGDWVTPFVLEEGNQNIMLAGYRNVWRSDNLSISLQFTNICDSTAKTTTAFINDIESSPANNKFCFFARDNGTFFKTSNVNAPSPKWKNISLSKPAAGLIRDIQCDYKDTNLLYIALNNKIYVSKNGGTQWQDFSNNLPDVQVYSIALDSSSSKGGMFCGTSSGVYYRDTVNKKWVEYKTGFPKNVLVTDMDISYGKNLKSANRLIAGTYGRGIWSTRINTIKEKPIAMIAVPFNFSSNENFKICIFKTIYFTDSSEGPSISHKWFVTPNTGISFFNNDSTKANNYITFSKPGAYNVSKVVSNCYGHDTFTIKKILVFDTLKYTKCHSKTLTLLTGNYGISNFTLNGVSQSSSATKGIAYENYSCKTIFKVKPNKTYPYEVTVNPGDYEYFRAYIDFNNDGKFSEQSEVIANNIYKRKTIKDSFFVPQQSVKNKLLRMRLMSDFSMIDTNSCPDLSIGRTIDYSILIEDEHADFTVNKTTVCLGDSVTFTNTSEGYAKQFAWHFGAGASPATAVGKGPHSIRYNSSGYKTIKLTQDDGLSITKDSMLYVNGTLNNSITANDTAFCEGQSAVFNSQLDSGKGIQYNWQKNNVANGVKNKTLHINNLTISQSGQYRLITNNGCFSDTSNAISISVNPLPIATFKAVPITSTNIQFTPDVLTHKSYLWQFGDGQNSSTVSPTHNFSVPKTYAISLTVTSNNDCTDSSLQQLIVKNTGINVLKANSVVLSPNPVSDVLTIQFALTTSSPVEISIIHQDGKLVKTIYSEQSSNLNYTVTSDLSKLGLNSGIYFIEIKTGVQNYRYKIIKL
ncbi:MAG: PKD domain-containing protein [Bacteroidota bacterium]